MPSSTGSRVVLYECVLPFGCGQVTILEVPVMGIGCEHSGYSGVEKSLLNHMTYKKRL